ncbi:hypothetical protein D3C77_356450 [compost metagenome]|jgi:hypothetical protein
MNEYAKITLAATVLIITTSTACAIGPTLPLSFEDQADQRNGSGLLLRVDPEQVRDVRIERQIYQQGALLRSEKLTDLRESKRIALPWSFKGIEQLPPGHYAEKIIAEGQRNAADSDRPLHIEQWVYFVVYQGEQKRISADEYEKNTSPSHESIGSDGQKVLVSAGDGMKGRVPLDQTKSTRAIAVGRLGGVPEEMPPGGAAESSYRKQDRSETHDK